jgi:Na+/melibiose symporter-like transporter
VGTADKREWLFVVRCEGLFFSGLTITCVAAADLGGLIAYAALDAIGIPSELVSIGANFTIPARAIEKLGLFSGPLPVVFIAIAPIFCWDTT